MAKPNAALVSDDTLLKEAAAAKFCGVSKWYLQEHRKWREPKVPYLRLSQNKVLYRVGDLRKFLDRLRVN